MIVEAMASKSVVFGTCVEILAATNVVECAHWFFVSIL